MVNMSLIYKQNPDGTYATVNLRTVVSDLRNINTELLEALEAAVERMEAVAKIIPIAERQRGVSPETHVLHTASHLAQHAKIARAAIAKAKGQA
jgi:hypothetical protein